MCEDIRCNSVGRYFGVVYTPIINLVRSMHVWMVVTMSSPADGDAYLYDTSHAPKRIYSLVTTASCSLPKNAKEHRPVTMPPDEIFNFLESRCLFNNCAAVVLAWGKKTLDSIKEITMCLAMSQMNKVGRADSPRLRKLKSAAFTGYLDSSISKPSLFNFLYFKTERKPLSLVLAYLLNLFYLTVSRRTSSLAIFDR